jgi:hypothetical protein
MARIREIVIDSMRPAVLARFWAAALDGYEVRSYDAAEMARLAELGLTPDTDPTVLIDGPGPILCFQQARSEKCGRNRLHLDLVGGARNDEVARFVALGARMREAHEHHTVMLDPEGNEFCIQDSR